MFWCCILFLARDGHQICVSSCLGLMLFERTSGEQVQVYGAGQHQFVYAVGESWEEGRILPSR